MPWFSLISAWLSKYHSILRTYSILFKSSSFRIFLPMWFSLIYVPLLERNVFFSSQFYPEPEQDFRFSLNDCISVLLLSLSHVFCLVGTLSWFFCQLPCLIHCLFNHRPCHLEKIQNTNPFSFIFIFSTFLCKFLWLFFGFGMIEYFQQCDLMCKCLCPRIFCAGACLWRRWV